MKKLLSITLTVLGLVSGRVAYGRTDTFANDTEYPVVATVRYESCRDNKLYLNPAGFAGTQESSYNGTIQVESGSDTLTVKAGGCRMKKIETSSFCARYSPQRCELFMQIPDYDGEVRAWDTTYRLRYTDARLC